MKDPSQQYRDFSPLQFCCALGLVDVASQLLPEHPAYPVAKIPDVQAVKSAESLARGLLTAVDIASMFGNVDVLKVICEDHGTPVDSDHLIPQTTWKYIGKQGWNHFGSGVRPASGTVPEEVFMERNRAKEQLCSY